MSVALGDVEDGGDDVEVHCRDRKYACADWRAKIPRYIS